MKVLIVDRRISKSCEYSLIKEGFTLIKLPADPSLPAAIASHPDTVMFFSDGEIITTADYCDTAAYVFSDIREYAPRIKTIFTADKRSDKYPSDCIMNAMKIGNKLFCKTDSVSEGVLSLAKRRGYEIIHTSQGYPACVTLCFGGSAITSDKGLASLLQKNGIRVTLIGTEGISLPPYEYGFIGGASGVVGDKVYFFGDINTHPDKDIIIETVKREGFIPVSLSEEPLTDLGGIIAL